MSAIAPRYIARTRADCRATSAPRVARSSCFGPCSTAAIGYAAYLTAVDAEEIVVDLPAAVAVPVILYNIPGRCGIEIAEPTLRVTPNFDVYVQSELYPARLLRQLAPIYFVHRGAEPGILSAGY